MALLLKILISSRAFIKEEMEEILAGIRGLVSRVNQQQLVDVIYQQAIEISDLYKNKRGGENGKNDKKYEDKMNRLEKYRKCFRKAVSEINKIWKLILQTNF